MPTAAQITAVIDSRLAALMALVQSKQAAYLASHGRYFQGLPSTTTLPADGVDVTPDNLASHPYYQGETWADMAIIPAKTASQITCDQYDGAAGKGYVITLALSIAGQGWQRAVNVGPETWRDQPWQQIAPPPL